MVCIKGAHMPTRRTLELMVITVVLMQPVLSMVKLWSVKAMGTAKEGTVLHGAGQIGSVIF